MVAYIFILTIYMIQEPGTEQIHMAIFMQNTRILYSDMKMGNILRKTLGLNTILLSQTVTGRYKQVQLPKVLNMRTLGMSSAKVHRIIREGTK